MSAHISTTTAAAAAPSRGRLTPTMTLTLQSIDGHGLIRASAAGSITSHDFPDDGKDPFETLLGENWKSNRMLLDLAAVNWVDSAAIGWLIGAQRRFREGGGRLVVHSVQPAVQQIFDVLKIAKVVPVAAHEQAARELMLGGAL